MKKILLFPFLSLSLVSAAQTGTAMAAFINPASVSSPKGYSHAAIVDLGTCKMIILSGQVALDSQGNLVGKQDFNKQAEQVFINLRNIIAAAGGTMDNLVKISVYLTDVSNIQIFRDVRNKFVNIQHPPASTLVEVSKLFRDDLLIEIEATAIIKK